MRKPTYIALIATLVLAASAFAQPILMIAIPPQPIQVGTSGQFTAMLVRTPGENQNGEPVTASSWTSSNPQVATVSNTGMVTGVLAGQTLISATYNGLHGAITVFVLSVVK